MCWDDRGAHSSGELHKLTPCADDLWNQKIVLVFKHNLWLNKEQKHREKAAVWAKIWPISDSKHHTSPVVLWEYTLDFPILPSTVDTDEATLPQTQTKCWFSSQLCLNLLGALFALCYTKTQSPVCPRLLPPNTKVHHHKITAWFELEETLKTI